jgi:hypothetical protein
MRNLNSKPKTALLILTLFLVLTLVAGCRGISYVPGASYGYYIWEENGRIYVEWSRDRVDSDFSGSISTDGKITAYNLSEWEEDDLFETNENKIEFSATLDEEDYSDGFSFDPGDYTWLEFDLKIDGEYDLERINLGSYLENPEEDVFKIKEQYFNELRERPWYKKHPFSEFFNKLYSNKYFTFTYLFILGIVIIEILRITVFTGRKRKVLSIAVSYAVLIAAEVCIFFILKLLVG